MTDIAQDTPQPAATGRPSIDPSRLAPELIERFWARVQCADKCWRWVGHIHSQTGYGSFSFRGRGYRAHRLSLMIHGHIVPGDKDACHHCDNRWCVNPDHLYVGTRKQNMADCTERRRHNKPKGETHWGARLSADDVRSIRALHVAGQSQAEIGARFSVHPSTISRIVRREWRKEVA